MIQTVSLSDICTKITSGGTPLTKRDDYYDGDIPWLRTQEVNFGNIYSTEKTITESGLNNSSAKIIPKDSVIVAMYGATAGKSAINKIPLTTNQACCNLIIDNNKADYRFVYYYLVNSYEKLLSAAVGAAQQNLGSKQISAMTINLPSLGQQKKIADILSSLDEKIELNRRMNETLEQLGQTLFRHYFVDNPEARSWDKKPLDEIANFLNGLAMQKYPKINGQPTLPVIKIREMSSGITDSTDIASANIPEEYIIHDGDLLFSWSGTLMVRFWSGGDGALNQHLFKVTSDKYPEWLYYYWTKYHLDQFISIAKSKATTMGHIQRKHLKQAEVIMPPNIKEMTLELAPIIDQIKTNLFEINSLVNIRDALLPKLISGEVEI
jgi:type I restriction-modification system, S subunit